MNLLKKSGLLNQQKFIGNYVTKFVVNSKKSLLIFIGSNQLNSFFRLVFWILLLFYDRGNILLISRSRSENTVKALKRLYLT